MADGRQVLAVFQAGPEVRVFRGGEGDGGRAGRRRHGAGKHMGRGVSRHRRRDEEGRGGPRTEDRGDRRVAGAQPMVTEDGVGEAFGGVGPGAVAGVGAARGRRGRAGVAGGARGVLAVDLEGTGGGGDGGGGAARVVRGAPQGEGEEAGQAVQQPHGPDDVPRVRGALDVVVEFCHAGRGGGVRGGGAAEL